MLWLIPGEYNIPANAYASLSSFFYIAPILLLFLVPALSMRSFAEEKRMRTLLLLKSRPITTTIIIWSKIAALFFTVFITLIPSIIYVISIYLYGNPIGNLDLGAVCASYIGLFFLVFALVCISVFASSITSNQVVALIIGMLFCSFFYFGFNLIGLEELSFLTRYKSIQRGLIETKDLLYFLIISFLFYGFILVNFQGFKKSLFIANKKDWIRYSVIFISLVFLFNFVQFRLDWTKDKRYTISSVSKEVLKKLDAPLDIEIYLTGNLNSGFSRLQKATFNLLDDLNNFSSQSINYQIVDPYRKGNDFIENLKRKGVVGISVNEQSTNGKILQNILFPYALIKYQNFEIPVNLLTNQMGRSGEENLNISIELLEYQLIYAIQLITQNDSKRIAFLEGHGELPEESISEILDYLSYEYTIDRGVLSGQPGELDDYDLVVIAGPQSPFTETDKFVLDQYLMQGGNLLWFVNGVKLYSYAEMQETGNTMAMANDLNLEDLFFTYGFRINPVVLQDLQSLDIPLVLETDSEQRDYIPQPWYYSPLLLPTSTTEITKGLSFVKTEFASTLSFVGEDISGRKKVLLSSSPYAHTIQMPAYVGLNEMNNELDRNYFNESNLPVAILLQSPFVSVFKNRKAFAAQTNHPFLAESTTSQMIVVASEDILLNPIGYDPYSDTQFANKEFVMNAVNYLTDNIGVSSLKKKSFQLQLLNKQKLQQNHSQLLFLNIVLPPALLLLVFLLLSIIRKRKYQRTE